MHSVEKEEFIMSMSFPCIYRDGHCSPMKAITVRNFCPYIIFKFLDVLCHLEVKVVC